jgi:hypothetical protein
MEVNMPELPQKKVGIVSCSGEELAEGTVTRLAALKVLEQLRPGATVTICLPLFLAGGEGDRAFAKFYPTIAIDGCEKRCAYRGTEMYSNPPAASIVVSDLVTRQMLLKPEGKRRLNPAGMQVVDMVAQQIVEKVDDLLEQRWNRREGHFVQSDAKEPVVATCSCGSGIPIQKVTFENREITLVALPLIFQNFQEARKAPSPAVTKEMMETVKIYNAIDVVDEAAMTQIVAQEYTDYWNNHPVNHG